MEEIEISGGSMSKLRNGHGSKCMCGKGRKVVLGPDNIKKLKKGGMRILRLSPEEIAENKKRMTDMMEGSRGFKKMKIPSYAKPVEGSGKVLHDWKDLFGGTIKRDAIDDIEDGDKRGAIDMVEMLRRPEQYAKGRGIKSLVKRIVDTADSELSKMGKGAKRAAGFTKKKFGDAVHSAIEGMGMEDRNTAIADMEGGKFSLHAPEWGIHKGSDLSRIFHSIVGAGLQAKDRKKRQAKATSAPQKAPRVLAAPAEMPNDGPPEEQVADDLRQAAAGQKKKKKTKAQLKAEASERMKKRWADGAFGARRAAPKQSTRIKDPLAWSTTKVPNKCGSDEQKAEAREAAQTLQRCPANEERREVRSDRIKQWEAKIRKDEREQIEGSGLYAGYPHGGGFIQPTGGMIRGGSIGARLSAPTNIGAGGNLLSPFATSKRPQAAFANFHMLQQMPVAFQPRDMFSSV